LQFGPTEEAHHYDHNQLFLQLCSSGRFQTFHALRGTQVHSEGQTL
jgi:hypothetical protein